MSNTVIIRSYFIVCKFSLWGECLFVINIGGTLFVFQAKMVDFELKGIFSDLLFSMLEKQSKVSAL